MGGGAKGEQAVAAVGQPFQHPAPFAGVDPEGAEIVQRGRFGHQLRGQFRLVRLHADGHGLAVYHRQDVLPRVRDMHLEALRLHGLRGGCSSPGSRACLLRCSRSPLRLCSGTPCRTAGGVGVVVHAEHQFARGRVNARSPAHHLIEGDRRSDVLEEHDVEQVRHVHARCQQVNRRGDKVTAVAAFEVGDQVAALAGCRAFEGVAIGLGVAVVVAPLRVQVAHRGRYPVGVGVTGAEDDGLLLRPARLQQMREQVGTHGLDAFRQEQPRLETGSLIPFAHFGSQRRERRSRHSVSTAFLKSDVVTPVSNSDLSCLLRRISRLMI